MRPVKRILFLLLMISACFTSTQAQTRFTSIWKPVDNKHYPAINSSFAVVNQNYRYIFPSRMSSTNTHLSGSTGDIGIKTFDLPTIDSSRIHNDSVIVAPTQLRGMILTIVIDLSGPARQLYGTNNEKLIWYLTTLANAMDFTDDGLSIIAISDTTHMLVRWSQNKTDIINAINSLATMTTYDGPFRTDVPTNAWLEWHGTGGNRISENYCVITGGIGDTMSVFHPLPLTWGETEDGNGGKCSWMISFQNTDQSIIHDQKNYWISESLTPIGPFGNQLVNFGISIFTYDTRMDTTDLKNSFILPIESKCYSLTEAQTHVQMSFVMPDTVKAVQTVTVQNPAYDINHTLVVVNPNAQMSVADQSKGIQIRAYPNPATSFIMIQTEKNQPVMIYDTSSQMVMKASTNAEINVNGLVPGVYYFRTGHSNIKIVVTH